MHMLTHIFKVLSNWKSAVHDWVIPVLTFVLLKIIWVKILFLVKFWFEKLSHQEPPSPKQHFVFE